MNMKRTFAALIEWADKSLVQLTMVYAHLARISALGHLGRLDVAAAEIERMAVQWPHVTLQWISEKAATRPDKNQKFYIDGLRKAGVPEG